ncbi:MAG: GGDEF domain-containing protein, partial [Gemmatimonadetes bacterium]|nr:GGDEF domain-containing protein [Gemmatimonadota bacterium]
AAASIGVAVARPGDGPDEVIRNADAAMYFAKKRGKRTFEVFAPAMHEAALERLVLEADLREAIALEQFALVYQPIVDIRTRATIGFEALVRWHHPARGLVSPAQFIPVAEETGQVVAIGRWVLLEGCRQAAEWRRVMAAAARGEAATAPIGDPDAEGALISVNVSARQFATGDRLLTDVRTALDAAGLPPRCLQLEITETAMMQDSAAALAVMLKLNQMGVRIAIDDFGTGYSSLSYLEKFPVHVLKIDKGFVDDLGSGSGESSLARAIIRIGRTLGMRVVAEGVETSVQAAQVLPRRARGGIDAKKRHTSLVASTALRDGPSIRSGNPDSRPPGQPWPWPCSVHCSNVAPSRQPLHRRAVSVSVSRTVTGAPPQPSVVAHAAMPCSTGGVVRAPHGSRDSPPFTGFSLSASPIR